MKPRAAYPTGRADVAESTLSRPLVASRGHLDAPLSSSLPRRRCTGKHSSCALHAAPFCRCATRARSLCHRAEPPPHFLSHGTACIASTQCTAIKGGHPLRLVRTRVVSASGKPSPSHSPLFSTTSLVPSHLTSPLSPYAGPRASPEPRAARQPEGPAPSPPLSSDAVDHAGELRLFVIHPPRFDSAPGTVSGRCTEVYGCFPWTSSIGSSSHRSSLAAPASRAACRVHLDVVCPRPPLRATLCQAAPHCLGHQLCAAWPSGSRR
jgi:hypothetical protein